MSNCKSRKSVRITCLISLLSARARRKTKEGRSLVLVAFLVSLLFISATALQVGVRPAYALTLFEDGFESGSFSKWSGTYTTTGDSAKVVAINPMEGKYHASFQTNGSASGIEWAVSYYTFPSKSNEIYARGYFLITDGLPINDNGGRFGLITIYDTTTQSAQAILRIDRISGIAKFELNMISGSNWIPVTTDGIYPQENVWYRIELYFKMDQTQGEGRVWINGIERMSLTQKDTSRFGGIGEVRFGLASVGVTHPVNVHCDSVVISPYSLAVATIFVDLNSQVMINSMSLGFDLDGDWKIWRDSPTFRTLAQNASFKFVRFFDWKSSSPKPCTYWNETSETGIFNWTDVNLLVQTIFRIGAQPIITLGSYSNGKSYVPTGMAINATTGLPRPDSFAAYAAEWAKHFKLVGMPVRIYEIWNEPDFYFYSNWVYNQTKLSYFFHLFNTTYTRMHAADPQVLIGNDATLFKVFLNYWIQHSGRLDYIAIHKYDSWGPSENDSMAFKRTEEHYFVTDGIWYGVNDARSKWQKAFGKVLPAVITEGNFAAVCANGTDPRIQQMTGAVWTALQLRASILNGLSGSLYYLCLSSATYSQSHFAYGLGFGMINSDNNQPWYPYYVQKLVSNNLQKGDAIINTTSSSDDVRSLAWIHGRILNLLIISKVDQPRNLHVEGLTGQLNITKIDNTYSYLSPKVQNAVMDFTQELVLNGYTVALLQKTI